MPLRFAHTPRRLEDFAVELVLQGQRAEDLEPILEDISDLMLEAERRLFETRGATSGVYWAPLKGSTIRRKQQLSFVADPFAPLRREDKLMKSLSVRGAEYQILEVTDSSIEFGTEHPAAPFHADGTRNMARRPPIVIPATHSKRYLRMIADYISDDEIDD